MDKNTRSNHSIRQGKQSNQCRTKKPHKAKKSIYDLKIPDRVVWVLGAEDKGMRNPTEKLCDELVSIPQASADASYNVSVSAALALAETKRQWAGSGGKK